MTFIEQEFGRILHEKRSVGFFKSVDQNLVDKEVITYFEMMAGTFRIFFGRTYAVRLMMTPVFLVLAEPLIHFNKVKER